MGKAIKSVTSSVSSGVKNLSRGNVGAAFGDYANVMTGGGLNMAKDAMGMGEQANPMGGGVDESGRPIRPGFQSMLGVDAATGKYNRMSLAPELQAKEVVGQAGRDQLAARATATGPSEWAKLQTQNQGIEEANALGNIGKQGASSLAQAQGNLARNGGMRSGVGAIMAQRGMQDQMMQKQQARRGGQQDRLNIAMQDDQTKSGLLQNLVGGDLQSQQYNIGNVIQEKRTKDTADMSAYAQDMQGWAAKQQGKAIAGSKPQGGFLSFLGM